MPRDANLLDDRFSDRAHIRVHFSIDGQVVTALLVQLEALQAGRWKPVRRYDDVHGRPHMDVLDPVGRVY